MVFYKIQTYPKGVLKLNKKAPLKIPRLHESNGDPKVEINVLKPFISQVPSTYIEKVI